MKKILTLAFFIENNKILLGYKKRGFGSNRWNGFGGKVEPYETLEEGARREVLEECGIIIQAMEKRAIHEFSFEKNDDVLEVHTFWVTQWRGEPKETEEMKPKWFPCSEIPYSKMWPDDILWLPQFLKGQYLRTKFHFGEEDTVLESQVEEVSKEEINYES